MDDKTPRVVRVTTLKDFQKEVPSGLVRLLSSKWQLPPYTGLPIVRFSLSLQGINPQGEIVWLTEIHDVITDYEGKGVDPQNVSIINGMLRLADIVRDTLIAQGYDVRDGDYGVPINIEPLQAHFECARWVKLNEREREVKPANEAN